MILQRLYELADREGFLQDSAFVVTPVACKVVVGRTGEFLGLIDLREQIVIPPRSKRGQPRVRLGGGRNVAVPIRPVVWDPKKGKWKVTEPASSGAERPAGFLADILPRVLPLDPLIEEKNRTKFQAQRSTVRRFLQFAAEQTGDPALAALVTFADQMDSQAALLTEEVERKKLSLAGLMTFEWEPDEGRVVLEREPVRRWWSEFYEADLAAQQEGQVRGLCQVTRRVTALSSSVNFRVNGLIPIGCRAEAYLVTGLTAANSFGLEGAVAGMVSATAVDGFTRGLNALITNQLAGQPTTSQRVGNVLFLFWTREPADSGVMNVFDPQPEWVDQLLRSPHGRQEFHGLDAGDENRFYLLALSGNSSRVVVRDYLEKPLPWLRNNLIQWFHDLRIVDVTREGAGKPSSRYPLWQLALSTSFDFDQLAPDTSSRLLKAALTGEPVSGSLLIAALRRLRAEGAGGFRPARMALIKLTLLRRGVTVTETLNTEEQHPAYICGRLLAVFEQIQYAALGDVNANVVDKFFGTFSAAPGMLLGRLFANAQNHLRKLRGEKPGAYVTLDRLLTEVSNKLPGPPRGQFSLQEQGLFALGYYHQRARRFEELAERKAKAMSLSSSETPSGK